MSASTDAELRELLASATPGPCAASSSASRPSPSPNPKTRPMSDEAEKVAKRLEAVATSAVADKCEAIQSSYAAASLIRSQAERIRVLEAALEPFRGFALQHVGREGEQPWLTDKPKQPVWALFTPHNFRRARAAMEPHNG